jgi:hypothetical protein
MALTEKGDFVIPCDDWSVRYDDTRGTFVVDTFYKGKKIDTIHSRKTFEGAGGLWTIYARKKYVRHQNEDGTWDKWYPKKEQFDRCEPDDIPVKGAHID